MFIKGDYWMDYADTLRTRRQFLLAGLGLSLSAIANCEEPYPNRPIKMIVQVPAGGGADNVARSFALHMSKVLNQQIVIENRAGAAGIIAMDTLAKSAPDGYTLIQTNVSTISINPSIYNKLPYDSLRDFVPISLTSLGPMLLVINPKIPARSIKELIHYAKNKPGGLSYGSLGNGSIQHLAGYMLGKEAGIQTLHTPYKGAAPVAVDLLSGVIDMAFSGTGTVAGHLKAGRLIALGQTTVTRSSFFPSIPTFTEEGFKKMEFVLWNGLLAPTGTPSYIIQHLSNVTREVSKSTELMNLFAASTTNIASNTPEEFLQLIKKEQQIYSAIVKESGIKSEMI
jgi:tripartite-type tricarboxylate transporter receptor subunit TctC